MTIRNNKLAAIAAILTTALTLASCELETSDNGKFDGFWHLERVDTLATGGSLNRDMEVWAAVRKTTSRRYLKDKRINFIELDFNSKDELKRQLADHQFDYIVHAAGVTKCIDKADFRRMNTEGTKHFVDAIIELGNTQDRKSVV